MRGDEDKMFDALLRKSLESYQVPPAPGVWTGIKHKLFLRQAWQSVLFKGNAGLIGSVSTGIVITGLTVWYLTGNFNPTSTAMDSASAVKASIVPERTLVAESLKPTPVADIRTEEVTSEIESDGSSAGIATRESHLKAVPTSETASPFSAKGIPSKVKSALQQQSALSANASAGTLQPDEDQPGILQETFNPYGISSRFGEMMLASSNTFLLDPFRLTLLNQEEMMSLVRRDLRSSYDYVRPALSLSIGFNLGQHWLVSGDQNLLPVSILNPSAQFRVKRDNLILETGFGISRESARLSRDTRYYPLVGSYSNLDSISFTWDTVAGSEIPVYHYHSVNVYDSLEHLNKGTSDVTYLFASIPVFAGYTWSFRRHNLLLKSGVVFSFLMNKSGYVPAFSATDSQVSSVLERGYDNAFSVKWAIEADYEYMITDKTSVFLGPVYSRYFRGSVSLPKQNGYFGIKSGLIWNF